MTTPHIMQTLEHKKLVGENMTKLITELTRRAIIHDFSKFSEAEAPYFDKTLPRLATSTFGSPGYQELLDELKPALDNHYAVNSHHPQYYKDGVQGMDLFDLIEMMADWLAATQRHNDGNIHKSLAINHKRFNIPDGLMPILENTINFLTGETNREKQFNPIGEKYFYCAQFYDQYLDKDEFILSHTTKFSEDEFNKIWADIQRDAVNEDSDNLYRDVVSAALVKLGFEIIQFTVVTNKW
jgi:hypothetical protein